MPAYMIRTFEVGTATVGVVMGVSAGVCGGLGVYLGGVIAQRLQRKSEGAPLKFCALAQLLTVPFFTLTLAVGDFVTASVLLSICSLLALLSSPTLLGLTQSLCKPRIRAMSAAIAFLISNLIALGVGPQVIGIASDFLRKATGRDGLGMAMFLLVVPALFAAYLLYRASKTLKHDMA